MSQVPNANWPPTASASAGSFNNNNTVLRTSGLPSHTTGRDDEGGPEVLFSMLEEAAPQLDHLKDLAMSLDEIQRRRDLVDHAWTRVRAWFYRHGDQPDFQAMAARIRGPADVTPLHLVCKLNNPPTDIVANIIEAAPDVVRSYDAHGWLPLHHACANGASTEVLQILTEAYPESLRVQDKQSRTPLHFFATRNTDSVATMVANAELLSQSGAAQLADAQGMLPMHYACAYGTHPQVLKVLLNAYPESFLACERRGRTLLHLALVNSFREFGPSVLEFLLEHDQGQTINKRDKDGNLPLHLLLYLLNHGLRSPELDTPEKRQNVTDCLRLFLEARPEPFPDFLAALQDLPDFCQDVAVVTSHVRDILNKKIIQRFPTFILMLDGYMLLMIIACFEIATTVHIDHRFEQESGVPPSDTEESVRGMIILLFIGGGYFLLRELIQIVALWSLGTVTSWFYDTTNWLDMAVIILTYYFSILMFSGSTGDEEDDLGWSNEAFRAGCAFTKGVLWMAVIYFLKSCSVDFAVFLGGVFYVVQRLVAFLLAVGVILLAFGQMFYIIYRQDPVCASYIPENNATGSDAECKFPHCAFDTSLLKVYTMMMGEIGSETRYDGNLVAQILYVAYAFLVVILLSNVLIAIVTDSYEIIQNDRAAIVFWSNRLDFVSEMDGISNVVKQRLLCMKEDKDVKTGNEGPKGVLKPLDSKDDLESGDKFRELWKSLMDLFQANFYDEVDVTPQNIEFWIYLVYQGVALFVIPVWILLGVITAGILWPPQVREYLFVQKKTVASRSELEKAKLDQLREIQRDMKALKNEIQKEMVNDRDDMLRMKAEVEAGQSDVLSDLQQVRELMTTLLDLGGIVQDQ